MQLPSAKKLSDYKGLIAVVGVLALLAIVLFATPLKEFLTVDKVTAVVKDVPDNGITMAVLLTVFTVGACLLMPMPLGAFAVGLIFPLWQAILIALAGAFLGSSSGYWLGRLLSLNVFGKIVKKHLDTVKKRIDGNGAYAVFALRIAPTPPFTITSILAGALKVPFWRYALASTLGILPLMLLVLVFGKEMLAALKDPSGMSALALVAVLLLYGVYHFTSKKWASDSRS